jgi:hypothetical protein
MGRLQRLRTRLEFLANHRLELTRKRFPYRQDVIRYGTSIHFPPELKEPSRLWIVNDQLAKITPAWLLKAIV